MTNFTAVELFLQGVSGCVNVLNAHDIPLLPQVRMTLRSYWFQLVESLVHQTVRLKQRSLLPNISCL
jgi:hypothetical protein